MRLWIAMRLSGPRFPYMVDIKYEYRKTLAKQRNSVV